MQIANQTVASIHYTLTDDDGEAAFWATLRSGYEAGLLNPQDVQTLWWRLERDSGPSADGNGDVP